MACRLGCVCGGLPVFLRLKFSGAGVSSLWGVRAGVRGGVFVGLGVPGSALPSSDSLILLSHFRLITSGSELINACGAFGVT